MSSEEIKVDGPPEPLSPSELFEIADTLEELANLRTTLGFPKKSHIDLPRRLAKRAEELGRAQVNSNIKAIGARVRKARDD